MDRIKLLRPLFASAPIRAGSRSPCSGTLPLLDLPIVHSLSGAVAAAVPSPAPRALTPIPNALSPIYYIEFTRLHHGSLRLLDGLSMYLSLLFLICGLFYGDLYVR